MNDLVCKECGSERSVGRRLCRECNNKRVRQYPRYTWVKICITCNSEYRAWRKEQQLCRNCHDTKLKLMSSNPATNNYNFTKKPGITEHREIAETTLGRKLKPNEVIHHMDMDPKNNNLDNLSIMSRKDHGKLHNFLNIQRVIIEKSINENQENCWNNLIVPMTTAWLETTSAKVQKLSEISQSAAEPLNLNKT